jgi:calcineurin-like phosphoesterase family protein
MPTARYWLTADLHFGHANIIKYCSRPYSSVEEMNDDLVDRWNAAVRPQDTVYVLGDLCMGKLDETLPYIGLLQGTKLLVPGNHDRMFRCTGVKWRNAAARYEAAGIEVIEDRIKLNFDFLTVLACHFPYAGDSGLEERHQDKRPRDFGDYLVHGHTHGRWRKNGRMVDVGVDAWGGSPVSFEDVAKLFRAAEQWVDPLPWVSSRG